ncbi:MAG: hypothetical protein WCH34_16940 [Bacteroidota bacterium]
MGHVKEPDGVDFVINSRPLTEEEEIAISDYIRTYKIKHSRKKSLTEKAVGTKRKKEKV